MNPEVIALTLPAGAVVKGEIYNTYDADYLSEDMLEIALPTGLTIDVGWYPEGYPKGAFRVILFKDYSTNQVIAPLETSSILEVVEIVQKLAKRFSEHTPGYSTSCSSGTIATWRPTSENSRFLAVAA